MVAILLPAVRLCFFCAGFKHTVQSLRPLSCSTPDAFSKMGWSQGWGQLFEVHAVAVVCNCEASVCSCNCSFSCGCLKPSLAVVISVVPDLKPPFALAAAVVEDSCAAVAVVLAVAPV